MIITFVGHSSINNCTDLSERVATAIAEYMPCNENTLFYCGGYGKFDDLCAKVCRSIKKTHPNCEVILVTPYITESHQKKLHFLNANDLYSSIIYPPLENIPLKYAISKRNEWMVNKADLIIAYVTHTFGGAYKTLKYARRRKKTIINLAD